MTFPKFLSCVLLVVIALSVLSFATTAPAQEVDHEEMMRQMQEDMAGPAAAGGVLACGCFLVVALVSLAIWIAISVYVYRDATARGMENAVVWLILVILTGLIGLIIYLIVRPPKPQSTP